MHYPYIDRVNPESRWDQFLTPAEKQRVELALKGETPGSVPLKLVLTGEPKYVGGKTATRVGFNDLYRYFSDPEVMATWKSEPGYAEDLEIIRKVYRAKLKDWDRDFADLFNLFNDPDIRDNTILIVTGDHGEALMEHGTLGHANEVYDEVTTFPMSIHFPGQNNRQVIESQFFQGTFVDLVRGLIDGKVTAENFASTIPALDKNKMIISRNCADTSHSVREENQWKYMERVSNDPMLFDLKADPKETKNVIADHPDVAAKLKFYLIDHANEFAEVVDVSPCRD
jgi:arylsulfatase A-like enzyme